MLRHLVLACTAAGVPLSRIVCVFADLGEDDEWPGTAELAAEHAAAYGLRFITVCRMITDPVTGQRRQQGLLEYIEHRGAWPTRKNRFCTSDLKRGPIRTVMTRLVAEARAAGITGRRVRVLNVLGLRAEESPDRRLMAPFSHDAGASNQTRREVDEWLPIHSWTKAEVWEDIHASGVRYHWAYDLGMPRLSCQFCILAPVSALVLAAQANPAGAARRLAAEQRMAYRRILVTLAIAWAMPDPRRLPQQPAMRLLKRTWRGGHQFKPGLSMAEVIDRAAAAPRPSAIDDWAA
jgi:3'-phosphoadenosine 5'-phosphosulfate sulfotransferase (PAPS reductase)/FAD synthetase